MQPSVIIGKLTLAIRDLTEKDLIKYSRVRDFCGKVCFVIELFFTGKGLFTVKGISQLLEKHPMGKNLIEKHPQLQTLLKTNGVGIQNFAQQPQQTESPSKLQQAIQAIKDVEQPPIKEDNQHQNLELLKIQEVALPNIISQPHVENEIEELAQEVEEKQENEEIQDIIVPENEPENRVVDAALLKKNEIINEAISNKNIVEDRLSNVPNITSEDVIKLCKGNLSILHTLNFKRCTNFTGASAIAHEKLYKLELDHTDVNNQDIAKILANCPSLGNLTLNNCKNIVSGLGISSCELQFIELQDTNLTDEDIELIIKNCPKLTELDLSDCKEITGSFIEHISPTVTKLRLHKVNLSAEAIDSLEQNGFNKFLSIWDRPKGFAIKSEELLNLDKKVYLENKIIQALNSKRMKLSEIPNLTDKDFLEIFQRCPDLTQLEINKCDSLTGAHVIGSEKLEKLFLNKVKLTRQDFEAILHNCPNLKSIALNGCDKFVRALTIGSEKLEELSLDEVDLRDEDLELIVNNCPHLKSVPIRNCNKISQANIDRLKQGRALSMDASTLNCQVQ